MDMRTFIRISPTKQGGRRASGGTRYLTEREQNPDRELPSGRQIFTAERDGLGWYASNSHLDGDGDRPARAADLLHFVFLFGREDAKELERESADGRERAVAVAAERGLIGRDRELFLKVERDRPYMKAVRETMEKFADQLGAKDQRWTAVVHRHTEHPHVHLLLHKDYADRETGDPRRLERIPKEFLNGKDERGRARGGSLDRYLSEALDNVIPQRSRDARPQSQPAARDSQTHDRPADRKRQADKSKADSREDTRRPTRADAGRQTPTPQQERGRRNGRKKEDPRAPQSRAASTTPERPARPGHAARLANETPATAVSLRSLGHVRGTVLPTPPDKSAVPKNDRPVSPHLGRGSQAASQKEGHPVRTENPQRPFSPIGTRRESPVLRTDAGRNESGSRQQLPHALRDLTKPAEQKSRQPEKRRAGRGIQRSR